MLTENRWLFGGLTLFSLAGSLIYASQMDPAGAEALLSEDGPIQIGSAVLHFAAAGLALALWRRAPGWFGFLALCAVLMGLRELDLHAALTTHGIFSTKLYAREYVPLHEKVLGAAMVATIAGLMVWRGRAALADWRILRTGRSPAVTSAVILFAFLPAIKLVDGAGRMIEAHGYRLSSTSELWLKGFEELAELALPLLVAVLIWQSACSLTRDATPLSQQHQLPI